MAIVKIEGNNNLYRDTNSKAILNTDKAALEEYLLKRDLAKRQIQKENETKDRLKKLETDMQEIKSLLSEIAQIRKV